MADGVNTKSMTSTTDGTHNGSSMTLANDDTAKLYATVQSRNIEVYTIALMVTDATVQHLLRSCATSGESFFDATDTSALESAFKKIAISLQTPYIGH